MTTTRARRSASPTLTRREALAYVRRYERLAAIRRAEWMRRTPAERLRLLDALMETEAILPPPRRRKALRPDKEILRRWARLRRALS